MAGTVVNSLSERATRSVVISPHQLIPLRDGLPVAIIFICYFLFLFPDNHAGLFWVKRADWFISCCGYYIIFLRVTDEHVFAEIKSNLK
ncbi:hypothetical protein [Serratia marcescens]|uniref:hypothetical protein n=1 Tax=Serratia marcescens TaxID=615 RepID=UPI0012B816C2|nr:hypothetical protein [Serratia marcescens]